MAKRLLLLAMLLTAPMNAAFAQTVPAPPQAPATPAEGRFQITVDVGSQAASGSFTDAFDVSLNTQSEHIAASYPDAGGLFFSVGARYRVWKHLTVGVGVSHFSHEGDATVEASLPHPFFDDRVRTVQGTAPVDRQELDVHPTIGVLVPLSSSVRLAISAGPSIMSLTQDFVTGVKVTETYPYDTAAFSSADVKPSSRTAVGFYAGADVYWMFSRHVGAGGLVQFSRATVTEKVGDRTVSLDAGGVQAGGGVRFVF